MQAIGRLVTQLHWDPEVTVGFVLSQRHTGSRARSSAGGGTQEDSFQGAELPSNAGPLSLAMQKHVRQLGASVELQDIIPRGAVGHGVRSLLTSQAPQPLWPFRALMLLLPGF